MRDRRARRRRSGRRPTVGASRSRFARRRGRERPPLPIGPPLSLRPFLPLLSLPPLLSFPPFLPPLPRLAPPAAATRRLFRFRPRAPARAGPAGGSPQTPPPQSLTSSPSPAASQRDPLNPQSRITLSHRGTPLSAPLKGEKLPRPWSVNERKNRWSDGI